MSASEVRAGRSRRVAVGVLGVIATTAMLALFCSLRMPWTLLGWDPEASRSAWNNPAIIVWHFRLDGGS